jgi:hypothetical protein
MTVANVLTPSVDLRPLLLDVSNAVLRVTPEHFEQRRCRNINGLG